MADIEIGQTFIDHHSTNLFQKDKAKYFIIMSCADCEGDELVCFVMNTERKIEKYKLWCNKSKLKFIIPPGTFSFITDNTAIMLAKPAIYKYEEVYADHIKLLDKATPLLCSQIKNCIDWNFIPLKISKLIKESVK
jgi:hypothetical protein